MAFFHDLTAVAWIIASTASTSPPNVITVGRTSVQLWASSAAEISSGTLTAVVSPSGGDFVGFCTGRWMSDSRVRRSRLHRCHHGRPTSCHLAGLRASNLVVRIAARRARHRQRCWNQKRAEQSDDASPDESARCAGGSVRSDFLFTVGSPSCLALGKGRAGSGVPTCFRADTIECASAKG